MLVELGTDVTINVLSLKSEALKLEFVIVVKVSSKTMSFAEILWAPLKAIVTTADPLVVVNALDKLVVDLIGCMS